MRKTLLFFRFDINSRYSFRNTSEYFMRNGMKHMGNFQDMFFIFDDFRFTDITFLFQREKKDCFQQSKILQ